MNRLETKVAENLSRHFMKKEIQNGQQRHKNISSLTNNQINTYYNYNKIPLYVIWRNLKILILMRIQRYNKFLAQILHLSLHPHLLPYNQVASPTVGGAPFPTHDIVINQVACFGQWDVNECNFSRSFKSMCAIILVLSHFCYHHRKNITLTAF